MTPPTSTANLRDIVTSEIADWLATATPVQPCGSKARRSDRPRCETAAKGGPKQIVETRFTTSVGHGTEAGKNNEC